MSTVTEKYFTEKENIINDENDEREGYELFVKDDDYGCNYAEYFINLLNQTRYYWESIQNSSYIFEINSIIYKFFNATISKINCWDSQINTIAIPYSYTRYDKENDTIHAIIYLWFKHSAVQFCDDIWYGCKLDINFYIEEFKNDKTKISIFVNKKDSNFTNFLWFDDIFKSIEKETNINDRYNNYEECKNKILAYRIDKYEEKKESIKNTNNNNNNNNNNSPCMSSSSPSSSSQSDDDLNFLKSFYSYSRNVETACESEEAYNEYHRYLRLTGQE